MKQPFDGMGSVGVIHDQPPWELPPTAWSDVQNVKFQDGAAEDADGQTQVYGTPLGAGYRLFPVSSDNEDYWVYTGLDSVFATNGTVHADISNGIYITSSDLLWNGGPFSKYLILNNGNDVPAYWEPNLANNLANLSNWEATLRAKVIRPFRNFLFALGCTEAGDFNPQLLRHSNGSVAGELPSSWDYTDPNEDTGRVEFGQTTDHLVDAVPLRDQLVIYKERHTWAAQYVGGVDNPFLYRQVFTQVGAMSQNCARSFEGRQIVLTNDDVVVHDLNQVQSVLDKRNRNWLFNTINEETRSNSFVVPDFKNREVWICFPTSGATYPTTALIWNWAENTTSVRELTMECPHIEYGVTPVTQVQFDGDGTAFDSESGTYAGPQEATALIMLNPGDVKLLKVDESNTHDGSAVTRTLIREALPLGDFQRYKRVMRVFPKLIGEGTLNISVGVRDTFEDPVQWSGNQTYSIGTDAWADFRTTGRIIDIRFQSTSPFRLHGFDVEFDQAGLY